MDTMENVTKASRTGLFCCVWSFAAASSRRSPVKPVSDLGVASGNGQIFIRGKRSSETVPEPDRRNLIRRERWPRRWA